MRMNQTIANLPIYVISLNRPEYQIRRDFMQKQMADRGLNFEFVNATDGRLPLSAADINLMGGENMLQRYEGRVTGGTVGCTISHLRCYKKLLASHHPYALILEDDALLLDDFIPVLHAVLKHPKKWNQIRLGYWGIFANEPFGATHANTIDKHTILINVFLRNQLNLKEPVEKGPYHLGIAAMPLGGGHGYLITREGSEFALKHYPAIPPIPIDYIMGNFPMPHQFIVSPTIVTPLPLTSSTTHRFQPGNTIFTLIGTSTKQAPSIGSTQAGTKPKVRRNLSILPFKRILGRTQRSIRSLLQSLLTLAQINLLIKIFLTLSILFRFKKYTMITNIKLQKYQKEMHEI